MLEGRKEGDKDYRTPTSNPDIGSRLRYLFNLQGKRLSPPEFDVDTVKGVYDTGAGGFGKYEVQYASTSTGNLFGTSINQFTAVGNQNTLGTGILNFKQESIDGSVNSNGPFLDWETRLVALNAILTLDGAGAVAMAGFNLDAEITMLPAATGVGVEVSLQKKKTFATIAAGTLTYGASMLYTQRDLGVVGNFSPGFSWAGWVPARQQVRAKISVVGGSFANNAFISYSAIGVLVPRGVQLPF